MATVKEHYEKVLAEVYSWMLGGFNNGIERNIDFFKKHNIIPLCSAVAIDLGAGCGFQSIPLSQKGFSVTAIDLDESLLNELKNNSALLNINIINDDLINFDHYGISKAELVVCMTDTILLLESKSKVISLIRKVFQILEDGGKFIITFRDLSSELTELERFIPVKSDDNMILTCFLEYEPEMVKVHDLLYKKHQNKWELHKSYYRKLRLSKNWIESQLSNIGFGLIQSSIEGGLTTIIAEKKNT